MNSLLYILLGIALCAGVIYADKKGHVRRFMRKIFRYDSAGNS